MTFKMAIDTPTSSTKTLELEVVRYEQLRSNDNAEVKKLAQALSDQGMLFLDLQGSTAKQFLKDLQTVIQHQRAFFEQPQEEKSKYHTGIRYNGWVQVEILLFYSSLIQALFSDFTLPPLVSKRFTLVARSKWQGTGLNFPKHFSWWQARSKMSLRSSTRYSARLA